MSAGGVPFTDTDADEFSEVRFAGAQRRRRIAVLLADISHSMNEKVAGGGTRIDALNAKLAEWVPSVRAGGNNNLQDVEFAVITFGDGGVRVVSGTPDASPHEDNGAFVPASAFSMGPFKAAGVTPMVEAVELAIGIAQRRQQYLMDQHGLNSGQPRLLMFSDGRPTDHEGHPTQAWRPLADRLHAMRTGKKMYFLAFGVPGVDTLTMRALAPEGGFFELPQLDFKRLLDLILIATSASDPYTSVHEAFGH